MTIPMKSASAGQTEMSGVMVVACGVGLRKRQSPSSAGRLDRRNLRSSQTANPRGIGPLHWSCQSVIPDGLYCLAGNIEFFFTFNPGSPARFRWLFAIMDIAYDHIQEEILSSNNNASKVGDSSSDADATSQRPNLDLGAEFQETFRAFSASPWGARLGGLWDNVRKQGESYYEGARQEYAAASEEAAKGFSDLRDSIVGRTRGLSLGVSLSGEGDNEKDEPSTPTAPKAEGSQDNDKEGEDGESFITRFRTEAAKRLKDIQKAEDAADEALLRFGTNIRDFLREAVSIAPPEGDGSDNGNVRFESKDAEGKRVIHATRFEAQLHVIHTDVNSFTKDADSDKWPEFKKEFDVEKKTDDIAKDLETYPDLRRSMEKLVPEQVEYGDFWSRYYFLRLVIETEEKKRRELLKGKIPSPHHL